MRIIRFFAILIAVALFACSRDSNKKLDEIDALCDSNPRLALFMLDSIDYEALTEKDRHYYDLLSIKRRDNAYVCHTSDSLILDIINYYSSHQDESKYPESLYYGGRVYSDIGDLPTALEYFQKAIEATPDDSENLRFKRNVLTETGRLLHALRLDSAAIGYLEKSISINEEIKGSDEGIAFAYKYLADSYLNVKDIKRARQSIHSALKLSSNFSPIQRASILLTFAGILDSEDKPDSALSVIRPLPFTVHSRDLPEYLSLASEIYRDAGILDTAYMYARLLTKINGSGNKRTGYKVIFSEKLRNFVPKDTLISFISEYKSTIEDYLNQENAILQNTRYNYGIHYRERLKAEKKLYVYSMIGSIVIIVSLILLSIMLYRKFIKADTEADIVTAINIMKEYTESPNEQAEPHGNEDSVDDGQAESHSKEEDIIKENTEKLTDIKKRILAGIRTTDDKDITSLVNPAILSSQVYCNLKERIESRNSITTSEETAVYNSLEELIESVSSGFFYRLRILTEDRITASERRMAMLMKCGFSPLQVSILFGREKNTISTHRRNLAFKITGLKKADKALDLIIISI